MGLETKRYEPSAATAPPPTHAAMSSVAASTLLSGAMACDRATISAEATRSGEDAALKSTMRRARSEKVGIELNLGRSYEA